MMRIQDLTPRERAERGAWARARDVIAPVLALVLALPMLASGEVIDRVLAIVAGESITMSDVRAEQALGLVGGADATDPLQSGLRQLIDRTLVLAEVRRFAPPGPGDKEVSARIEDMRRRLAAPGEMARVMSEWGISENRLRVLARDDLLIRSYLTERFGVSDLPAPEQIDRYTRAGDATIRQAQTPAGGSEPPQSPEQRAGLVLVGWISDLRQRAEITLPDSSSQR